MKLIYKSWGSDPIENPKGYPSNHPKESTRISDGALVPAGWTEISEDGFKALITSTYSAVAQINDQIQLTEKADNDSKLDALKRLFDRIDDLEKVWDTATNAQKFDGLHDVIKILLRHRRNILEQYRPDNS